MTDILITAHSTQTVTTVAIKYGDDYARVSGKKVQGIPFALMLTALRIIYFRKFQSLIYTQILRIKY